MFFRKKNNIVEDLKTDIYSHIDKLFEERFKNDVERLCMDVMKDIFSDTRDSKIVERYYNAFPVDTIGKEFKKRAIKAVEQEVGIICKKEVEDLFLGESLIDDIISRINRKQLIK